jgi:hypothetical protein
MAESIKDYGIKYRVIRLDEKRCLLFPVSLVKGEDLEEGFQTNRTIYSYASTEEDYKNKYIVDNVFAQDELEFIYEYEGDEDFLGDYFFDDHKDTIVYVDANDKDEWRSRRDVNLNTLCNKEEISFLMDDTLPAVVFNEQALKEIADSNDLNEVKLLITHACLVAKDATFRALTTWVDCENCKPSAVLLEDMNAELVDTCALACTRHAANADAHAVAGVRQALLDDFLRNDLMLGNRAFDESDGLPKNRDVSFQDALHIVGSGEATTCKTIAVEVRIDDRDRTYATVHSQACIFGIVFRMLHIKG